MTGHWSGTMAHSLVCWRLQAITGRQRWSAGSSCWPPHVFFRRFPCRRERSTVISTTTAGGHLHQPPPQQSASYSSEVGRLTARKKLLPSWQHLQSIHALSALLMYRSHKIPLLTPKSAAELIGALLSQSEGIIVVAGVEVYTSAPPDYHYIHCDPCVGFRRWTPPWSGLLEAITNTDASGYVRPGHSN